MEGIELANPYKSLLNGFCYPYVMFCKSLVWGTYFRFGCELCSSINDKERSLFSIIIWSLWREPNDKLWSVVEVLCGQ